MSTIYGNALIIPSMEEGAVVSVQDNKAVTITSNGTVSVTPDAPYDALKKVDVTVNVDAASVSTVTINCEDDFSDAYWLSPDGVVHNQHLNKGANTIIVAPYSQIGVYNVYGYTMTNLNNIVYTGTGIGIKVEYTQSFNYYHIYYATATIASATQPTD